MDEQPEPLSTRENVLHTRHHDSRALPASKYPRARTYEWRECRLDRDCEPSRLGREEQDRDPATQEARTFFLHHNEKSAKAAGGYRNRWQPLHLATMTRHPRITKVARYEWDGVSRAKSLQLAWMEARVQEKAKLPPSLKDPSTLFFQHASVRRLVILAYWVVFILALPIWWYTTSIERLPLPLSQASQEIRRPLQLPVSICVQESTARFTPLLQDALGRRKESQNLDYIQFHVVGQSDCGTTSVQDVYTIIPGHTKRLFKRTLEYPLKDSRSVEELSQTLLSLITPQLQDNRAAQFASRYRLSFSLLNEDAASGNIIKGWNIEEALQHYITPILHRMSHLHNFTIESQVQFHAPLAFEVQSLPDSEHGLSYEDLTVFVNSAEWTLCTISTSSAFILPQWGGIVLYNPSPTDLGTDLSAQGVHDAFSSFANQLLSLLGVPSLPPGIQFQPHSGEDNSFVISDWQMDSLLRRRTVETVRGTKETLRSFIKLVKRIENMPIGKSVSDDVHNALESLNKVYTLTSTSLSQTFTYSAKAFNYASRAFFNPGMLALLYFPAEHKYAIYTPLFSTAMAPLIITALREVKAWRKERGQARAGQRSTNQRSITHLRVASVALISKNGGTGRKNNGKDQKEGGPRGPSHPLLLANLNGVLSNQNEKHRKREISLQSGGRGSNHGLHRSAKQTKQPGQEKGSKERRRRVEERVDSKNGDGISEAKERAINGQTMR
ncbi:hypothetical protein CC1G_11065 [Coprinopsis cinerea okayama7|uniref:GPI transamidase component PIG-S n=1 Tax=Coprinopsis cinerea (strain Okayama-7 / 130 / ATCC MYA-4618 / FGSC 9003) TaxID=240176 RepID=A8NC96_COPC7|nr:hypothetical protein CC1G_11065 [Coprinopsis cinerea okayama7\|eukprot:XP_001832440.2 hypothetical protein CC1G_11065 [Coprinopsis cinerea okayama7\